MFTVDELQERLEELQNDQLTMVLLANTSRSLNAVGDENDLLRSMAQTAIDDGASQALLYYTDENEQPEWIEVQAVWTRDNVSGWHPQGARFHVSQFPLGATWLLRPSRERSVDDVDHAPDLEPEQVKALRNADIQSFMYLPLAQGKHLLGMVLIAWSKPHAFTSAEIMYYDGLIDIATPVVQSRRLLRKLRHDIVEREQAERALRESELRYRLLADNASDMLIRSRPDGTYVYVSPASKTLFGFEPEEMLGQNFASFLHPDDVQALLDKANQDPAYLTQFTAILRHRHKDGQYRWSETVSRMVTDPETGEMIENIAVVRDVTARKQAEDELRQSQQLMGTIINSIPARVFWKDRELNYLGCNQRFADDAGIASPEALTGKNDFDMGWKEQAEAYRADDLQVIHTGAPRINYEEPQTTPDGSLSWLRTSKIPLRDTDGKIIGVLGIYEDITEHKRAEAEREHLQQQVIDAQRQALQELSTPIIPILNGIIVMPLVGSIDTSRATDIMRSLLAGITQYKAEIAILDITGVPVVDSGVAQHLDKTIQAARLKGARTLITGVTEAVAETIVDLGIDWSRMETVRDLQTGLLVALKSLGMRIEVDKKRNHGTSDPANRQA